MVSKKNALRAINGSGYFSRDQLLFNLLTIKKQRLSCSRPSFRVNASERMTRLGIKEDSLIPAGRWKMPNVQVHDNPEINAWRSGLAEIDKLHKVQGFTQL